MSFGLRARVDIVLLPDGVGGMTVPDAQVLTFFNSAANPAGITLGNGPLGPASLIPGGNAPSQANIITALNNLVTDLTAQLTPAVVARIDAFATGGG